MKNGIKKFILPRNFVISSGFTLIELLLVITIIGLLSGASFAAINKFSGSQNLNIGYEDIKNELNYAKSSALSQVLKKCISTTTPPPPVNREFQGYEFHYNGTEYWVEEVCDPVITSPIVGGEKKKLPDKVTFTSSGAIRFEPLGGGTNLGSNRVIKVQSGTGSNARSKDITVYPSGVIE